MIDGQIFQQTKKAMIDGQDGHSICFGKESSPQSSCLDHFKKEFAMVILRAKDRFKSSMSAWLEAIV